MFKRLLAAALLLAATALPAYGRERVSGWCEQGGNKTTTGGLTSTESVQQSFPSCTITVYDVGTLNLASIFSDDAGTAKANPFTASATGFWFWYADDARYDVRLSGGGIVTPFTIGDILLDDTKNDVTTIVSVASSATPTFDASLGTIFTNTLTANVTSSTISNPVTGQRITIYLAQDGTGGWTFAWPANVQLRGGGYVVSDDVSAVSTIALYYDGTNWREIGWDADEVGRDLIPTTTSGRSLGTSLNPWDDSYVDHVRSNNIRFVDQFAGANAGVKLVACIAALPATGGICDARGLEGAQVITANPFVGVTKPVVTKLCGVTLTTDVVLDMSTMQDSTIKGCPVGGASSIDAMTIIKAGASFPATSPIIDWSPASQTEARMTLQDLFLDADNIAQDGVFLDNFGTFRIRRVTIIDALRYGFQFGDAGTLSFGVEAEDLYSNGADTAAYHVKAKFVKCTRCVSDSGATTATSILFGANSSFARFTDGHFEGGAIGVDIAGGGGEHKFAGNIINPGNAASQIGVRIADDVNVWKNKFVGNDIFSNTGVTQPAGSTGIQILGTAVPETIIGLNNIRLFRTGIALGGDSASVVGNVIDVVDEGITITSSNNSIVGGTIQVSTGTNAINEVSGESNSVCGVVTADVIVGAGCETLTDVAFGGVGATGAGLDNYKVNILADDDDLALSLVPNDDANLTARIFQVTNAARSSVCEIRKSGDVTCDLITGQRFITDGTALVAGDFGFETTGEWGDTADAAVSAITGNDQWFQFTMTAGGANTGANPDIRITYKDGTWTTVPIPICVRQDNNAPTPIILTVSSTATVLTIVFVGTPTATNTYKFACQVGGI